MKKYIVIKQLKERNWEPGDIVSMDNRSAEKVNEYVKAYEGSEEAKHVAIMVDPVPLSTKVNN